MKGGWVYVMTDAPFGTLYIGVTSDLATRVWLHRNGKGSAFCRRYGLTRLVYCEQFERIDEAIAREKAMKAWRRRWKTKLIEKANPTWDDLYEQIIC
jgi:putative endonuclease